MEIDELHVHQFKETVVLPSCKECGYTVYTCDCGYKHKTNFKPVAVHTYQSVETTPATCTKPGKEKFVCTTCAKTEYRALSPLGHSFGEWSVRVYPTCMEPGKRIRSCSSCGATEEMDMQATGHRCAPGTARYKGRKLMSFFCQNCGKTIQCVKERTRDEHKPTEHKATKAMLIINMCIALICLIFLTVAQLSEDLKITDAWLSYTIPGIVVIANILLFATTDTLRQRENYTRWLGILFLVSATMYVFMMLPSIDRMCEFVKDPGYYPRYYIVSYFDSLLQYALFIGIQLILSVMHFVGKQKKYWIFTMVLLGAFLHFVIAAGTVCNNVFYAIEYGDRIGGAELGWRITRQVINVLVWVESLLLIHPGKRKEKV